MPDGEISSTVPEISSTGAVKCRSVILMTDSRSLFHPVEDLLVFDFEFGISLCFLSNNLTECVVLP